MRLWRRWEPFPAALLPTLETANDPWTFTADGTRWLFYHGDRLLLHPIGQTKGYQWTGETFGPDVSLDGQTITVAFARNEAETPDHIIRSGRFELGVGMVPLTPPIPPIQPSGTLLFPFS